MSRELHRTRFSHGGGTPHFSPEKPDIPLREPLEEEGRNKRKQAREMLEYELKKMVIKNKNENEEKNKKEAEKLKVIIIFIYHYRNKIEEKLTSAEKRLRSEHEKEIKKARAWEAKRLEARQKAESLAKQKDKELTEKFKTNEKKRSATLQKKIDEKRNHEKLVYENDQKHYFEIRNKSLTRKLEEDDEVNKALEEFENKMEKRHQNKVNTLNETSLRAEKHINYVMKKLENVKQKKEFDDTDPEFRIKLEKSIKRKIKSKKERELMLNYKRRKNREKLVQEQQKADSIIKQNDKELYERNK